jgi:hypothetical protein
MPREKGSVSKSREFSPAKLRVLLKPIHKKLTAAGIPKVRIPTNDAILSLVLEWVDQDKVDAWIETLAGAIGSRATRHGFRKKVAKKA